MVFVLDADAKVVTRCDESCWPTYVRLCAAA
jgi:hypothetical protein